MHREEYVLYKTYSLDTLRNQLHREFRPAVDKLVSYNRCIGQPYTTPTETNGMRWCSLPAELLFKSVTIEITRDPVHMPIIKTEPMCVNCDEEESEYLLGK